MMCGAALADVARTSHDSGVNYVDPFHLVRNELDAIATGRSNFSLATAHILVDQTASIIRTVIGQLPQRCSEHLARASAAAANNAMPKFIHEIEAVLMHAEQH